MVLRPFDEQDEVPVANVIVVGREAGGSTESSRESLRAWLHQRLATLLRCRPEDIDPQVPFTVLGLDSLSAFSLTGELAHRLQRELPATLLWEFATVEQVVQYLAPSSGAAE